MSISASSGINHNIERREPAQSTGALSKVKNFFKNEKVKLALKITAIVLAALAVFAAVVVTAIFAGPLLAAMPAAFIALKMTLSVIATCTFFGSAIGIQKVVDSYKKHKKGL